MPSTARPVLNMYRKAAIVGVAVVGGAVGAVMVMNRTSARFDAIFNRGLQHDPACYDRTEFRKTLRHYVSHKNPVGIVFVTGRIGAGKSTLIQTVLADRNYVADINWRGKSIHSADDLNDSLKQAFAIKTYKDYVKDVVGGSVQRGLVGSLLELIFPSLDYHDANMHDLGATMAEIEKVLRFAVEKGKGKLQSRPVIFIDEIHALNGLLNGNDADKKVAKDFVSWLVIMSRDWKLCDIVFCSHDGFAMEILALADAAYCVPIVIPSFSESDMQIVAESFPHLSPPLTRSIHQFVAGHAEHVMKLVDVTSMGQMRSELDKLRANERKTLREISQHASFSCRNWQRPWKRKETAVDHCYELADFEKVMRLLAESPGSDPSLSVDTVMRRTDVDLSALQSLVYRRYLFYNPADETISARNKLFLSLFQEQFDQRQAIEALKVEMLVDQMLVDDIESAEEHRELARNRLQKAEERLVQLEKAVVVHKAENK